MALVEVTEVIDRSRPPARPFTRLVAFRRGLGQKMIVPISDSWVGRVISTYGEYSEPEVDLMRDLVQPADLCINVGANLGAHAIALAELAHEGTVVALEPQRLVHQMLCGNVALASKFSVDTLRAAAGDVNKLIYVPTLDPYQDANFGGLSVHGDYQSGDACPMITLDSLGVPEVDFILLDCEGNEPAALRGAAGLIREHHPWIYFEFEHNRAELLDFFAARDYECLRHWPSYTREPNFNGIPVSDADGRFISDMVLAVPKRRNHPVKQDASFATRHMLTAATPEALDDLRKKKGG